MDEHSRWLEPTWLVKPVRRNSSRWLKVLKLMEDKTHNGFTFYFLYSVSRGAPRARRPNGFADGLCNRPKHTAELNNWPAWREWNVRSKAHRSASVGCIERGLSVFYYMWIDRSIRCIYFFFDLRWKGGYCRMLVIICDFNWGLFVDLFFAWRCGATDEMWYVWRYD